MKKILKISLIGLVFLGLSAHAAKPDSRRKVSSKQRELLKKVRENRNEATFTEAAKSVGLKKETLEKLIAMEEAFGFKLNDIYLTEAYDRMLSSILSRNKLIPSATLGEKSAMEEISSDLIAAKKAVEKDSTSEKRELLDLSSNLIVEVFKELDSLSVGQQKEKAELAIIARLISLHAKEMIESNSTESIQGLKDYVSNVRLELGKGNLENPMFKAALALIEVKYPNQSAREQEEMAKTLEKNIKDKCA